MRTFSDPIALYEALKHAWSAETSSKWTELSPARGQCGVTALVVQDYFGGDILKTRTADGVHFYNRIEAVRWDLTISRFSHPIPFEDLPATREEAMADTSAGQYESLKARLGTGPQLLTTTSVSRG